MSLMTCKNILIALALVAACALLGACGGGDSASSSTTPAPSASATPTAAIGPATMSEADAEAFMRSLADDYNNANADAFLGRFTDQGLAAFLGDTQTSPSDLRDQARSFIGSGAHIDVQGIDGFTSEGGKTTFNLDTIQGNTVEREQFVLVQQNGGTLVDGYTKGEPAIPAGATRLAVGATEAKYDFDASQVSGGDIAFVLTNNGTQQHEMVLAKVDDGPSLTALEESAAAASNSSNLPDGYQDLVGAVSAAAGKSETMVFAKPLDPGRYAFFCFIPDANDPTGQTFAAEGMATEFTVP